MAAAVDLASYKETILFLTTAGIVVPLFTRLRVSPVLGFMGAGALLGPYGLGSLSGTYPALRWITVTNSSEVAHLAELGVVFLLFTIGLELSWARLRILRRLVFGLGSAQVVISALLIGSVAIGLGLGGTEAAIVAAALSLSSTAIVVPILAEKRRLNSPTGRTSFSVLLFQDLAVAPALFAVAAMSGPASENGVAGGMLIALAQATLALAAIVLLGRLGMRPLFHLVALTRSSELFMAASFLVVIGAALLAAGSGMSMALGAFLAGLLLAETEYRRAIEATVEPFKGLLLGVFFVSIGMGLDFGLLAREPLVVAAIATGLVAAKALIVIGLARVFGLPGRVGVEAGLLLGPGGEFAFVLIGAALAGGLLPYATGQTILVATSVTMIAIPAFGRLGRRIARRIPSPAVPAIEPTAEAGRVIIAGFGRVGQLVADMLSRHGVPYLAIDSNAALVTAQREAGRPVYFGDPASRSFLGACGVDTARAMVITIDSPAESRKLLEIARGVRPDLTIVARARDARHAVELYRLGVTDAVPETVEASLQLSEAVLVDIGIPMGPIIASIHERRDEFRRAFQAQTERPAEADGSRPVGEFRSRRTVGRR